MKFNPTIFIIATLLLACQVLTVQAQPIPTTDAFGKDQAATVPVYETYMFGTRGATKGPMMHEVNPNLTDHVNEDHPYPEYMAKFIQDGRFPEYYEQLLEVEPDDHVQSKIFDEQAFRGVRRIGVVSFENKTKGPGLDHNAGNLVAEQVSSELDTVGRYAVIRPKQMVEEYQIKIRTTPESRKSRTRKSQAGRNTNTGSDGTAPARGGYDLPYASDKIDAVMIGAVTRYSDTYYDQQGRPAKSPSVAMEFGAYLISTRTGKALWGARFVGSQKPRLLNLQYGKLRFLNKREFTQYAVRKVLKDFSETQLGAAER